MSSSFNLFLFVFFFRRDIQRWGRQPPEPTSDVEQRPRGTQKQADRGRTHTTIATPAIHAASSGSTLGSATATAAPAPAAKLLQCGRVRGRHRHHRSVSSAPTSSKWISSWWVNILEIILFVVREVFSGGRGRCGGRVYLVMDGRFITSIGRVQNEQLC